jgi:hypothetical protein
VQVHAAGQRVAAARAGQGGSPSAGWRIAASGSVAFPIPSDAGCSYGQLMIDRNRRGGAPQTVVATGARDG